MPRARKGAARHRAKRRVMKRAKGYVGGRHRLYRTAKEAVAKAGQQAYADRRRRKRDFRRLWITRISAACRQRDISYSRFIGGLVRAHVEVDRKTMADMAVHDPGGFDELVKLAREHAGADQPASDD